MLTARGFQYFIAAFLLEDLKTESPISGQVIWDFSQAVLEDISPIKGVKRKSWFKDRVKILSIDQRACLVSYFHFLEESEDEEVMAVIHLIIEVINEI